MPCVWKPPEDRKTKEGAYMLELEVLQDQLGRKKGSLITQDTVDELNRLAVESEYGPEFIDAYSSYFNVMEKNSQWTTPKYMSAMKFFTLMESGHNATDAYVKTFPERLEARHARGENKSAMGGEASRYNASALVNEIRKVATVPIQLIHRNLFHKMIQQQAHLAMNASSEMVRQKAGEVLIRELKPAEDSTVNIKVGMTDEAKSQQAKLVDHIGQIALQQQKMLAAGLDIAEIQKLNIQISQAIDVEELEYDDE